MTASRTFVIGDVHGHVERLAALLDKAGVLDGQTEIVLLGDIGHYGAETRETDLRTWQFLRELRARVTTLHVLWGNHDYANVKPDLHGFRGHMMAAPEVMAHMRWIAPMFALEREGYLLTHAGLAPRFAAPPGMPLELAAGILNECEGMPAIDDISYRRGGTATQGGILWRDETEPLADIPQIFGHSRGDIRRFGPNLQSWCIDVAGKEDPGNLAGLWLDTKRIVAVGPDAEQYETPWEDSE